MAVLSSGGTSNGATISSARTWPSAPSNGLRSTGRRSKNARIRSRASSTLIISDLGAIGLPSFPSPPGRPCSTASGPGSWGGDQGRGVGKTPQGARSGALRITLFGARSGQSHGQTGGCALHAGDLLDRLRDGVAQAIQVVCLELHRSEER